jgi:hypothetical protein
MCGLVTRGEKRVDFSIQLSEQTVAVLPLSEKMTQSEDFIAKPGHDSEEVVLATYFLTYL